MPAESTKKKSVEAAQKKQLAETLAAARAEVDPDRENFLAARVPPLVRDADHSFVPAEPVSNDPELVQPDLTSGGTTAMRRLENSFLEENATVEVNMATKSDAADERMVRMRPTPEAVERMTDDQIKDAGLLKNSVAEETIHPARLSPSSERPRTPLQKAPAAGPGTWPVPADALPAAMPSDPPADKDRDLRDASFSRVAGISVAKDSGDLTVKRARAGTQVVVPKKQVGAAAALWLSLRQQYPDVEVEDLRDEFALQLESMIGESQSHRPASEVSPTSLSAVGDQRIHKSTLAAQRQNAPETDTEPLDEETQIKDLVDNNDEVALRNIAVAENVSVKTDHDKADIARAIVHKRMRAASEAPASNAGASGPKVPGQDDAKKD